MFVPDSEDFQKMFKALCDEFIEEKAEDYKEDFSDRFFTQMDQYNRKQVGSPIEKLMFYHLLRAEWGYTCFDVSRTDGGRGTICTPDIGVSFDLTQRFYFGDLTIFRQFPIAKYKADFALVDYSESYKKFFKVIVECDGHDFHDRTKEQASKDRERDRFLQKLGWQVLRFTGSDIHKKGQDCAQEVADVYSEWIENLWKEGK